MLKLFKANLYIRWIAGFHSHRRNRTVVRFVCLHFDESKISILYFFINLKPIVRDYFNFQMYTL